MCYLLGDWRIYQRLDGHRWSLDDLVTAWLAARVGQVTEPARVLDLGCGIGSVVLMCAWHFERALLTGVEAQPVSVDLARRSVWLNGVEDRVEIVEGDLRDVSLPDGAFDLVTGTPPYWPPGRAHASEVAQKVGCRFEERGGVEDYCRVAARALTDAGVLVLCHEARSRERLLTAAASSGLEPVAVVDVVGRAGKPPMITVAAFGRAGREPLGLDVDPTLVVRDRAGQWTPGFAALRRFMGMPTRADVSRRRGLERGSDP